MADSRPLAPTRLLPQGRTLPADDWQRRHWALLTLLWVHVAGLPLFALAQGNTLGHALFEGSLVACFAVAAVLGPREQRFRGVAVSFGLIASSAELVHLWDGQIEAHFHFFVVISLLALYEDWLPFGLAFAFVVGHHGVMGAVDPESVYNHRSGWAHPWRWAMVHGGFVMSAGVAAVIGWRLNERTRARMIHQSLHDPLTGLPNRLLFLDRLAVALARARRTPTIHAVLFVDIDHFKVINDSLGHHAGDEVLVALANRLDALLRANDSLARFGGDEFTVLAEDLETEADAVALAERLVAALAEPMWLQSRHVTLSGSVGIAITRGAETADDLLRDADAAMYRAKERGRARVEIFDGALRDRVLRRLEIENDLRRALERGELCTHYQPKVRLDTGEIVGVEALARWQHPERGMIPPAEFIPMAEETGLIVPLGEWILREACCQVAAWNRRAPAATPMTVAVNLSARQLEQHNLLETVADALAESGLPATQLCLEITESTVMRDVDRTIATLLELKQLGVQLAIDDFGVGFSSLSQLKRLPPVDMLKIDKSFIDGIGAQDARAIVAAILTLAGALELTTVAEGVEAEAQATELATLGCELAQGYLFARPQPPDQLEALLAGQCPPRRSSAPSRAASPSAGS
jgi:diguanylate cyclase (GGDEF)-like protein